MIIRIYTEVISDYLKESLSRSWHMLHIKTGQQE